MTVDRTRANVALLAAQAVFFGVTSALLVIPANGIFLAAYGAEWLPLTYVGIAIIGAGASIVIARSLRRWTLPTVSVAVLVAVTATLIGTWAVTAATGSAWPSAAQLILFPILLQLGFVIIGGQAGRLLDLQQIKRFFPRVVAGFVVGFTIGGFAGVPLLDLTGAPEHLVVVSAMSCAVFALLVRLTSWRRPAELTVVDQPTDDRPRRSLRSLLTTRFVALVFAYQVLSAMGSQVLDFLVFDRAAARYGDASELTRFVALFTGVLNVVDLLFLVVVAGLLLSRFGLRLGLLANPAVVTALTVGMLVAVLGPGASSLALFSIVVITRIVDIALTDGTTRGSINAVFQVLPVEERLAIQAGVEGIGVPLAIGATGVMLLVMNALDLGTSSIVGFAFVLCGAWTLVAIIVYRDYRRALAARLRRRGLDLRSALPGGDEERSAARRLMLTDDVRDIRLGLDLALTANVSSADLAELETHEDAVVRVLVFAELARRGDEDAGRRGGETARRLADADDITGRRAAAVALSDLHPPDREELLRRLLADSEAAVHVAALDAVGPNDAGLAELVVSALHVPTTVDAALDASRRLGTPAIAAAANLLSTPGPVDQPLVRLVSASDATRPEVHTMVAALVTHPDRSVSIAALGAIARAGGTVDADVLDQLLGQDAGLSARVLAASTTMTEVDAMMLRALDDELQVARTRVLAVLAVRHGEDRIGGARRALSSSDGPRRALGVEMLQISLSRREAALVDPVVRDDLAASERLRRLRRLVEVPQRDRAAWLAELAVDDERRWASPWLQAVGLYTELLSAPAVAARHAEGVSVEVDPALAEVVRAADGSRGSE